MSVLNTGRNLWQAYFTQTDTYPIREEFKLNRPDVGWYQIRNALKKRNLEEGGSSMDFSEFESSYRALSEKLVPKVYEYGFLKP